jgi:hypothetical protein
VEDGQGHELVIMPKRVMEAEVGSADEILRDLVGDAATPEMYPLIVLLAAPVPPGGSAVIRLSYQEPASRGTSGLIPKHWFTYDDAGRTRAHDTFVEISAPPESAIEMTAVEGMPSPGQTRGEGGVRLTHQPQFLQVRIPPEHGGVRFRYRLRPLRSEWWLIVPAFHVLWTAPLGMLVLAGVGMLDLTGTSAVEIPGHLAMIVNVETNPAGATVGALGIAAVLAVVAFLRPIWTNRVWFWWPGICNAALLAISLK